MTTALSSIADPSLRDWVDKEVITAPKLEADYKALNGGVKRILQYLEDNERNFPGGSAPVDIANGMTWYDSLNALHKGRVNGRWESIKGGVLNIDATQNNLGQGNTGVLVTYTLPLNTLEVAGVVVRVKIYGTKSGTGAVMAVQPIITTILGSTQTGNIIGQQEMGAATTDWVITIMLIMATSNTYKRTAMLKVNNDDGGRIVSVESVGAFEFDTDKAVKLELQATSVNAADTAIFEGMIVELLA